VGKNVLKVGAVYINNDKSPGGVSYIYTDRSNDNALTIGRGTTLGSNSHLTIKDEETIIGLHDNLTILNGETGKISFQVQGSFPHAVTALPNTLTMLASSYVDATGSSHVISDIGIGNNNPVTTLNNYLGSLGVPYNIITLGDLLPGGISFQFLGREEASICSFNSDLHISAFDDISFYTGLHEDPARSDTAVKFTDDGDIICEAMQQYISVTLTNDTDVHSDEYNPFDENEGPPTTFQTNIGEGITFDAANGHFTISKTGDYEITAVLYMESDTAALDVFKLEKNGNTDIWAAETFIHNSVEPTERTINGIFPFIAGTFIEVRVEGTNLSVRNGSGMSIKRIA